MVPKFYLGKGFIWEGVVSVCRSILGLSLVADGTKTPENVIVLYSYIPLVSPIPYALSCTHILPIDHRAITLESLSILSLGPSIRVLCTLELGPMLSLDHRAIPWQ